MITTYGSRDIISGCMRKNGTYSRHRDNNKLMRVNIKEYGEMNMYFYCLSDLG